MLSYPSRCGVVRTRVKNFSVRIDGTCLHPRPCDETAAYGVVGHLEASAGVGVAHGQLLGAAVGEVLAARGLGQRAARPREAVAEEVAQAAACGACTFPELIRQIAVY